MTEEKPYEALKRKLAARYDDARSYLTRPVAWVTERSGSPPWSAQREVIESVRDNRYTAVHSAHDLGKSWIAAQAIAWWIDSHPPGDAFVVSTAPTAAQVAAILWREITKTHNKAKLPGKVNRAGYPQWFIGNELVGYGRKPADYEESAFQGIHAKYVLIVIDEAGGVARHLYDAVDALATNEYARVLAIGNPDDAGSHFAAICKPGSDWNVVHLDGLRSPNMTREAILGNATEDDLTDAPYPLVAALMLAENIPFSTEEIPPSMRAYLLSPLWVEERIRRWCGIPKDAHLDFSVDELGDMIRRRGAQSPLFQAKVRGIFPTSSATGVIPLGWVQQAINRWHDFEDAKAEARKHNRPEPVPSKVGNRVVGVDVAYSGQDETCVTERVGDWVGPINRYRHADTIETADHASVHLHEPASAAVVDVIGIGAGVYDTLRRYKREGLLGEGVRIVPFNAAAATTMTDKIGEFKFRNDRAAAWWRFREWLDPSRGSTAMLPDDEWLIEELVAVKYEHLAGGIIKIESKDEIKKRLGRSTDSADSVVQTVWIENLPGNAYAEDAVVNRAKPRYTAEVKAWLRGDDYEDEPASELQFDERDFAVSSTARGHGNSVVLDEWDLDA